MLLENNLLEIRVPSINAEVVFNLEQISRQFRYADVIHIWITFYGQAACLRVWVEYN